MDNDLLDWFNRLSQAIEDGDSQKVDNMRVEINNGGLALEEKYALYQLIDSVSGVMK